MKLVVYFQSLRFVRGDDRDKRKNMRSASFVQFQSRLSRWRGCTKWAFDGRTEHRASHGALYESGSAGRRREGFMAAWILTIFDHINAYQKCIFFNKEQLRHFACMRCTKCKTGKNTLTLSYFRAALSVRKYCFYVIFYLYLTLTSL